MVFTGIQYPLDNRHHATEFQIQTRLQQQQNPSSHSFKCCLSPWNLLCISSLLDADAENKYQSTETKERSSMSMGRIIAVGCWMMPCRESWAGLTATLVLSILCPYHHHTGVETLSIFRQSWGLDILHSTPKSRWFVPCLIPHTQGSEIDTDWLTSGIIWIISVLGPRLGNSVTLRLHNNDLATAIFPSRVTRVSR